MEFRKLTEHVNYFDGVVNIGYVQSGDTGLLIDTGIDDSTVKKAVRYLRENEFPLTHLFLTHAHADHYGGAAFLRKKYGVITIAPKFEAAIMENPTIEPLYLSSGNDPLPETRNKFLEGPPVKIDRVVEEGTVQIGEVEARMITFPGHSYNQGGLVIDNILFAADSYFGPEYIHKHKIPYITDSSFHEASLHKLLDLKVLGAVPGHGVFEQDFKKTVRTNLDYYEKLTEYMKEWIRKHGEVSHEELVAGMCRTYGVETQHVSAWLLYRTAVTAFANGLMRNGEVTSFLKDYRLFFSLK
ncbi:MBL fold metallo-hydrolase [Salimicrobium salexigens]|uniref:Glyoxylase, beta-lactamase superfamily II n=1 Tax=Salimicrobium salexigens TaxID=908941 RepID=A0ABY1KMZ1_9BACI|nr:MBL fold metallo-hydrolase [Salimicrobium salexigens]SIS45348.1 Glyoxylase, beta-lactamase superfamily II [Salimicrobium salexigens]